MFKGKALELPAQELFQGKALELRNLQRQSSRASCSGIVQRQRALELRNVQRQK
jgi:hypothetical protein